ncbi:hypothetical protein K1T71_008899 [Dendrolimus kikuchii]|uniref:Uncharacterized protein n=1 Tax=Dendrolimus kikuchii TaxID=765133 RepID=A0ACC1CVR1_9NEOP|nr:hypothetical protein K1T71_008899 [Dendrolimus kikuchii]
MEISLSRSTRHPLPTNAIFISVLKYFGHVARKNPGNMERLVVTQKVEGKRPRGRSPNRWIDQIADQLDTSINSAYHWNRSRWKRAIVHCHQSHEPQQ